MLLGFHYDELTATDGFGFVERRVDPVEGERIAGALLCPDGGGH